MPYESHDYQMEAIVYLLDRTDVLFVTATGTGKTDTFIRLMHVVLALSKDHSLHAQASRFPPDPAMLIVCPTKALEYDMERKMIKAGLKARAVNADTVDASRKKGVCLFDKISTGVTMILLSPEQLKSPGFAAILDNGPFGRRIAMMAVDEAHLLNSWGKSLRPAYMQVGFLRARLATHPAMLVTTATLEKGGPTKSVCECLGLQEEKFHFIRRSNLRGDIRLVFREMRTGMASIRFPELKWLLEAIGCVVVFCRTIALGFRVAAYLYCEGQKSLSCNKQVRMFNSLNWSSYNEATLAFLNDDPSAQIIVATDTLSVGFDSPNIKTVVIFGETMDTDDYLQKAGRIRISGTVESKPSAIIYLSNTAVKNAKEVLASKPKASKNSRTGTTGPHLSANMARLILAPCKVKELNETYDNPIMDIPCKCCTCSKSPSPSYQPDKCDCSGCVPEPDSGKPIIAAKKTSKSSVLRKKSRK
ncbi:hypothetical protein HYDPIDRAFT_175331 [Hydnomerulius pinastri MD-312]|uniref:DNA 3'-5' helicase n=1 Tax=Hydnomerulius pinastri MD-312 TaxID=994086 RepID=A0A0C9W1M6_9AGAM|nr:hypothetical protein HYDPIDRAFT_175331 [Hydnomerulius pinastri MD-312]